MINVIKRLVTLSLFLTINVFAQSTDKLPSWLDFWRNVTVSIGQIKDEEVIRNGKPMKVKMFSVVGTGALFYSPGGNSPIPVLVTAKHNFWDPEENWYPRKLQVRISAFDEKPVDEYFGATLSLWQDTTKLWFSHPDSTVDLACIPFDIPEEHVPGGKVSVVPYNNFATLENIYEGAPIAVLGYPGAVGYTFWSKAILRQGIIAWVSPKNPDRNVILIDCNVFPGNSGGPVFGLPIGIDRSGSFNVGGKIVFLGLISQGRIQQLPVFGKGKPVVLPSDSGLVRLIAGHYIGIGVVEPVARVSELLRHLSDAIRNH